jgi:hypothetical protein
MALRLRPRFRVVVALPVADVSGRFRRSLDADGAEATGTVLADFIVLRVPEKERHFWSPELTLQLAAEADGRTLVRALFGPHPSVWTGFAAFYVFTIFLSLIALLFGLSQWSLDIAPMGLWLLPIPLLLLASAYAVAWTGQRLGHEQMVQLRARFDDVLEQPADPLSDEDHPGGDR